ncbi:MAG: DnaD domain protein [Chloroflexi bacterium]|nr:MAG: DnaD domain protein [Chloroflexota bacterium]
MTDVTRALDQFEGFIAGGTAVTLPAQLFAEVLPAITDEAELRVTLYALYAIGRQRGALRAVRGSALASEGPLLRLLAPCGGVEALRAALDAAVARGTLLDCALADGDTLYLVNNEAGRRAVPRIVSGALPVPGGVVAPRSVSDAAVGGVARVYEQEIGALTGAIADALAQAEARWPTPWIVDALRLAAVNNARSWRYAEAILERWETEGKDDGTTGSTAAGSAGGTANRNHGAFEQVIRRG